MIIADFGETRGAGGVELLLDAGDGPVTIGRCPESSLAVRDLTVSRAHLRIDGSDAVSVVADLGSTNGTFINGRRVDDASPLRPGDVLSFGPYSLRFDGRGLRRGFAGRGMRIDVQSLSKDVTDRETGRPLSILSDISLTVQPGQFVGLLGSSGCGKSTFMDAVNGRRPATKGSVLFDGSDLYTHFDAFKCGIGYVPQQLIFHEMLPLADALRYTSRLRLASDATEEEIETNINTVLETVGLADRRDTVIANLSGGQKKRVSMAMELLSAPTTLFLDEVTSGLDLGTEQQMMHLFRTLADEGMTVVCISHYVDSLELCDMIAYFVGGMLAFYGPPEEFRRFCGIEAIRDVYTAETDKSPEQWQDQFRRSPQFDKYVQAQTLQDSGEAPATAAPARRQTPEPRKINWAEWKRQFGICTKRYVQTMTVDNRGLLVLTGLAPLVAVLICILARSIDAGPGKQNILCFGSMMTLLFLGLFGAIREVVKELAIYRHERFITLQIVPYLASKIVPLAAMGAIQTLMLLFIINIWGGMEAGNILQQFSVLFLVYLAGTTMGLAISSAVGSSDQAVMLMIVTVVPQVLFSGAMFPLRGAAAFIAQTFVVGYWGQDAITSLLPAATQKALPAGSGAVGNAVASALAVTLHILLYALLALVFLVRKDGPGAVKNMLKTVTLSLLGARERP